MSAISCHFMCLCRQTRALHATPRLHCKYIHFPKYSFSPHPNSKVHSSQEFFPHDDLEDLEDVSSWGSWETFLLRIFPLDDLEDLDDLSSRGSWETFLPRIFPLDDLEDFEDVPSWGSWETFNLRIFPLEDLEDLEVLEDLKDLSFWGFIFRASSVQKNTLTQNFLDPIQNSIA